MCLLQTASRPVSSPSISHLLPADLLPSLDLGGILVLRSSIADLTSIFRSPIHHHTDLPCESSLHCPLGPRHLPVHCLLVSCICTLLGIYTDPAARFPISLSSPREASTIRGRIWTRCMVPPSPLRFLFLLDAFPAGRATRDARHTLRVTCPVHLSDALTIALTALAFVAHE